MKILKSLKSGIDVDAHSLKTRRIVLNRVMVEKKRFKKMKKNLRFLKKKLA